MKREYLDIIVSLFISIRFITYYNIYSFFSYIEIFYFPIFYQINGNFYILIDSFTNSFIYESVSP